MCRMIGQALASIQAAVAAESEGFTLGKVAGGMRVEASKSGAESLYCNREEEAFIAKSFDDMWQQAIGAQPTDGQPNNQSTK